MVNLTDDLSDDDDASAQRRRVSSRTASKEASKAIQILSVDIIAKENPQKRISLNKYATNNKDAESTSTSTSESETSSAKRRRKSAHVPIVHDDELEFTEEVSQSDDNSKSEAEQSDRESASRDTARRLANVRAMEHPNRDLMKKAAFLRVSVPFMLETLGMKPLVLGKHCSLANLKAQYVRNKRL